MKFPEWLKRNINRKGLTQTELGLRAGVSQSTVSAWCRGAQDPKLSSLRTLVKIFGEPFTVTP